VLVSEFKKVAVLEKDNLPLILQTTIQLGKLSAAAHTETTPGDGHLKKW
jgi:hypothetical protein